MRNNLNGGDIIDSVTLCAGVPGGVVKMFAKATPADPTPAAPL
jgi:hypothetical protein